MLKKIIILSKGSTKKKKKHFIYLFINVEVSSSKNSHSLDLNDYCFLFLAPRIKQDDFAT